MDRSAERQILLLIFQPVAHRQTKPDLIYDLGFTKGRHGLSGGVRFIFIFQFHVELWMEDFAPFSTQNFDH